MKKSKVFAVITLVAMLLAMIPIATYASISVTPGISLRDAGDQEEFTTTIILTAQNAGDIAATESNANQRKVMIAKPEGWNFTAAGTIAGTGNLAGGMAYPAVALVNGNLEITLAQGTAASGDKISITNAQLTPDVNLDDYLTPGIYHARISSKSTQVVLEGITANPETGTILASVQVECVPFWDVSGEWEAVVDGDEEDSVELELSQNSEGVFTGTWTEDSEIDAITNGKVSCRDVEFRVSRNGDYYDLFQGTINSAGTLISGTYERFLGTVSQGSGTWIAEGQGEKILQGQIVIIDSIGNLALTQTQLDVGYNVSVTGCVAYHSNPNPKLEDLTLEVRKGTGSWEVVDHQGSNLNLSSQTLAGRSGQQGSEFNFVWEISEVSSYSLRVVAEFTPELDYPNEIGLEGPVVITLRTPGDNSDGLEGAAASAIANKILKDAGINHRYFTGDYKKNGQPIYSNYISDVAKAMEKGNSFPIYNFSKTKIGYAEKSNGSSYYDAVYNYLKYVLGAEI